MQFKTFLTDVINHGYPTQDIETLSIDNENGVVTLRTFDSSRLLIIVGKFKEACDDITGKFGLSNIKMLKGIVNNKSISDGGIILKTRDISGEKVPDRIEFKGKGASATFRLVDKRVIPDQPEIKEIPWDIEFSPDAELLTMFKAMALLYTEIDKNFILRTEQGNLVVSFGLETSSTHSGNMILSENVGADISGDLKFPIGLFLDIMKSSGGSEDVKIKITNRGLLCVQITTLAATYDYMLKKVMD